MSEEFLKIRDLEVVYTQNKKVVHAVNGVSLILEKGKTVGLVGETGAGKTTIAKSVLGILPVPPAKVEKGEIWLEGEDLLALPEEKMLNIRGQKIAMIFQDPMTALNPLETVGEQILEVIQLHNDYNHEEAVEKACEMLEMVGIPKERYVEYPHQFSGGMKQRVVIAMALACNPDLLLADEPTTALDVTIQAQVLDLINNLRRQYNTSMILITHDLGVVAETCDDVAIIYAGKIVEYGTKREEICSKALLILIVSLVFISAVVRYFNISWTWSLDLTLLLFAWFSFFASSQAIRRNSTVNMVILVERLPKKLQQIIAIFNDILMVAFMCIIVGYTVHISQLNWRQSITSLGISYSWILLSLAVGGVLMTLGLVIQFGQHVLVLVGKKEKPDFELYPKQNGGTQE